MRLLFTSAFAAGIGLSSADAEELVYVPNTTKRICQLTGDFDRVSGVPTLSQTGTGKGHGAVRARRLARRWADLQAALRAVASQVHQRVFLARRRLALYLRQRRLSSPSPRPVPPCNSRFTGV